MNSKVRMAVDGQGEIPLTNPQRQPVEEGVVFKQPTFSAAIRLSANCSGLEEKEIYVPLGIDASHWTRILNGKGAHFPTDKLELFMDLVGNEIPLQWLAHRRGKGLVLLLSEAERRLNEANELLAKEREKSAMLADLLKGKA